MSNESAKWLQMQSERTRRIVEGHLIEDAYMSMLMIRALAGTDSEIVDYHKQRLNHIVEVLKEGTIYERE